eukprot:4184878-Pleurochrysis_carterae.AAC.2
MLGHVVRVEVAAVVVDERVRRAARQHVRRVRLAAERTLKLHAVAVFVHQVHGVQRAPVREKCRLALARSAQHAAHPLLLLEPTPHQSRPTSTLKAQLDSAGCKAPRCPGAFSRANTQ